MTRVICEENTSEVQGRLQKFLALQHKVKFKNKGQRMGVGLKDSITRNQSNV